MAFFYTISLENVEFLSAFSPTGTGNCFPLLSLNQNIEHCSSFSRHGISETLLTLCCFGEQTGGTTSTRWERWKTPSFLRFLSRTRVIDVYHLRHISVKAFSYVVDITVLPFHPHSKDYTDNQCRDYGYLYAFAFVSVLHYPQEMC